MTRFAASRATWQRGRRSIGAGSKLAMFALRREKYWLRLLADDARARPRSRSAARSPRSARRALITFALKAPARPRSLVITTIATRLRVALLEQRVRVLAGDARQLGDDRRERRSTYGRAAMIASCARRSFAAATSFIARVILRVFLTLTIRLRMAFRLGMARLTSSLRRELLRELGERVAQLLLDVALELARST